MVRTVQRIRRRQECAVRTGDHVIFIIVIGIFISSFFCLPIAGAQEPSAEKIRTFVSELYGAVSVVTTRGRTGDAARAVRSDFDKAYEALRSALVQQKRMPSDWSVCATLRLDLTEALDLLESGRSETTEGGQILHRRIVNIASTLNDCREVLNRLEEKSGR